MLLRPLFPIAIIFGCATGIMLSALFPQPWGARFLRVDQDEDRPVRFYKKPVALPGEFNFVAENRPSVAAQTGGELDAGSSGEAISDSETSNRPATAKPDWPAMLFNLGHSEFLHKDWATVACTKCHVGEMQGKAAERSYLLKPAAADEKESKSNQSGFLGVHAADVSGELAAHLNLEEGEGALILKVLTASPAYHCGLEKFDVLRTVDGKRVMGQADLARLMQQYSAGRKIRLKYIRMGSEAQLDVVLGEPRGNADGRTFQIARCEAAISSDTNCRSCHRAK